MTLVFHGTEQCELVGSQETCILYRQLTMMDRATRQTDEQMDVLTSGTVSTLIPSN